MGSPARKSGGNNDDGPTLAPGGPDASLFTFRSTAGHCFGSFIECSFPKPLGPIAVTAVGDFMKLS